MSECLFSIVVPVYNVELYLEKCVDSLLHQENMQKQIEILLIDDGSQDKSGIICDRLAEQFSCIKVIHKENGGLSSARNTGIENATGRYVLFVDSDDFIENNTCDILRETLEEYGEMDALVFDGIEEDGIHHNSIRRISPEKVRYIKDGKTYLLEQYKARNLNVEAWLYAYRRFFLVDHGLRFREGILHEDVEFTPRAMLECGQIAELPNRLYHYIVRDNSISTQKNKDKNIRDLFSTLKCQSQMAEQQEPELEKWMKNGILDSYLNMVQDAGMYQKQYRNLLNKRFLLGKAATGWNHFRVLLCFINIRLYCFVNNCYKKLSM